MTRYINNPDNLKLMMNMLREKSRNIQFEAFHVFKVREAVTGKLLTRGDTHDMAFQLGQFERIKCDDNGHYQSHFESFNPMCWHCN